MAQFLWDLVDYTELTRYVRAYDQEVLRNEANFVLDSYLPNVETDEIEFRVRKGGLIDVDAAEFRAWDTPTVMSKRQGMRRISGELAPIGRQISLTEEEFLRKRAFETQTNEPIVNQIYADAENMVRSVQVRVELARGDLIDDGILTISEGGLDFNIDWGRSATASPTAAAEWTPTTGTPLADLLAWMEDYDELNGVLPSSVVISRQRLNLMATNPELRNYASAGGTTPTRLNRETIDGILASEGLPPFLVYDGQFRVNGVRTRVLNQNKVYLMPPGGFSGLGETRYGVTAEALKLRERGFIEREEMPGVVAVVTHNEHPVQTFTNAAAIAVPIMPNPDLVFDCTVAS